MVDGSDAETSPSGAAAGRERGRGRLASGADAVRTLRANLLTFVGFLLVVFLFAMTFAVWFVPLATGVLSQPFSVAGATVRLLPHAYSLAPYPPNLPSGPGNQGPSAAHWFGTDPIGYDLFSRVLVAFPLDIGVAMLITLVSVAIGLGLGLVSGFFDTGWLGRSASVVILRVTDVFLAFPTLIFALAISTVLGRTLETATVALIATWWPYYVRLVRGEVLSIRHRGYIAAARALGVPERRILSRHVLRNLIEPLVVYATLDIGTVVVTFSTIAFIGIQLPPTTPEWGSMISLYQSQLPAGLYLVVFPGLAIFLTVLSLSLFGDGLQQVLDPRTRRAFARSNTNIGTPTETPGAVPEEGI